MAKVLFPFTMLSTISFATITLPFLIIGLLQFPVYGLILGDSIRKGKLLQSIAAIVAIHVLTVSACFYFIGESFL